MDRIYRIDDKGQPRYAVEQQGQWRLIEGDIFDGYEAGEPISSTGHRLLAPVVPSKIVCVGLNYKDHAAEVNKPLPPEPLLFIKPSTSVIGPGEPIVIPPGVGRVDHEAELAVVIGRRASRVSEADAHRYIFGLTCVNDVTALDLLNADASFAQWARAKGCDSFGPVGPAIATGLDWSSLRVQVALNGRVRQDYPASDMILPPARIVSLISREMTLEAGDVIACGTSLGALPMRAGMVVEVTIEGIGTLRNTFAP
jgi:2-keto-4-pentenoate hydratase/2-oxohepta-3-ene-1,7-dioic acid hydratase in catechol pathway